MIDSGAPLCVTYVATLKQLNLDQSEKDNSMTAVAY